MIGTTERFHLIDLSGEMRSVSDDAGAEERSDKKPNACGQEATGWAELLTLTFVMTLPFVLVAWLFA